MPDENPAAATATDENTEAAATAEAPAGPGLKKALEAERELRKSAEKRAKDAETARDELTEKLTTAETERDEAKTKIAEITSARVQDLRVQVAKDAGLDPKIASRLTGSTREELEADAELIASAVIGSGGGLDGGARRTTPSNGTPVQRHAKFIGALLGGADGEEAAEAAGEELWS